MNIGIRIKIRRKMLGLSVRELAKLTEIAPATLYRYENGELPNIPVQNISIIAKALKTNELYLMGITEDPEVRSYVVPAQSTEPILAYYYELNAEGQEKLLAYAEDLIASRRYAKKYNPDCVVEA